MATVTREQLIAEFQSRLGQCNGYDPEAGADCWEQWSDPALWCDNCLFRQAAAALAAPPASDPPGLVAVVKAAQDAALAYNQIVFGDSALSRAAQARRDAINAVLDYNLSAPPAEQDARARAMEGR